jgi:FKBP-type peptidyl-prolyl cis-trans isomerase
MRTLRTVAALALAVVLAAAGGCGRGGEAAEAWIGIVPGLAYIDSLAGEGAVAQADDFVEVSYEGWLWQDGERGPKVVSSRDDGRTFAFSFGRNAVIEGWERGLPGMRIGGVRKLLVGPEMGYGEQGAPPHIPGGATLLFVVEMVSMPETQVEILEPGDGPVAAVGDQVAVHYSGWVWEDGAKGQPIGSSHDRGRPYRFTMGQGMAIAGWDVGLTGMAVGARARLIIPPIMAYGRDGDPPRIPPDATLMFEVELVEIQGK